MNTIQTHLMDIALHSVRPSRWQPRAPAFDVDALLELANSIQEHGMINEIIVFPVEDDAGALHYELVAGERRTRASIAIALATLFPEHSLADWVGRLANVGIAGLGDQERTALRAHRYKIAAKVKDIDRPEDYEALHALAVTENLDRQALSPLEEASAFKGLIDAYGYSQRELARRVGKSQGYVGQRLALLRLNPPAIEAVNTRVLNTTHARAIGAVPEPLQDVVTRWAVNAVRRADAPATTRQVQNRARQVANFVDPARWQPNAERVYEPQVRNRLALIRWAVEGANLDAVADDIFALASYGYLDSNLLNKKPIDLVQASDVTHDVVSALLPDHRETNSLDEVWDIYAPMHGKTCETCRLHDADPGDVEELPGRRSFHCPRWHRPADDIETCDGYIGPDDPLVIPVDDFRLRDLLKQAGAELHGDANILYMVDVAAYVQAVREAVHLNRQNQRTRDAERQLAHLPKMQAYYDLQAELTLIEKMHFQAHACLKCAHHQPLLQEEGLPPCYFANNPLQDTAWKNRTRAPEFGLLVRQDGTVLPRCQAFIYSNAPVPQQRNHVISFGHDRHRVVTWLTSIGMSGGPAAKIILWGALGWLNYGRKPTQGAAWSRLQRYLLREWDDLGGDPFVVRLLDTAQSESAYLGRRRYGYKPFELLNFETGELETWLGIQLSTYLNRGEFVYDWPEDWIKPWGEDEEDDDGRAH